MLYIYSIQWIATNVHTVCSSISTWKVKYERERDRENTQDTSPTCWHGRGTGWLWLCLTGVWPWVGQVTLTLNGLDLDNHWPFLFPPINDLRLAYFSFAFNHPLFCLYVLWSHLISFSIPLFYRFLPCHPDTLFLSSWVCEVANVWD